MVMPGDRVKIVVELIVPVACEQGMRFAIREGGKTVGAGVIQSIIEWSIREFHIVSNLIYLRSFCFTLDSQNSFLFVPFSVRTWNQNVIYFLISWLIFSSNPLINSNKLRFFQIAKLKNCQVLNQLGSVCCCMILLNC